MRIENVTVSDTEELLRIYSVYVKNTAVSFEYDVPTVEEFEKRIENITSRYPYIKAVDENGNILGYAYAGPYKNRKAYDWSVETTVYVRQDCKRKGAGRMLYDALENQLKEMEILNMYACIAYTDEPDEYLTNDSMRFHEALGFELIGTFHKCGCKFGKWYDMIWMEKFIGEHIPNPPFVKETDK